MNRLWKKAIIIGIILLSTAIWGTKVEASTRLSKPKSVFVEMKNRTDVKVKWQGVRNARKYQVYYTTGNRYKKLCTTKKTTYVQKI